MTAIHQNSISNRHSIDEHKHQSGHEHGRGQDHSGQYDEGTPRVNSSTVTISFNAELRLRAYQEQRKVVEPAHNNNSAHLESINVSGDKLSEQAMTLIDHSDEQDHNFSQNINHMLSEVENNIVQKTDPGYQYLVNVLNNNKEIARDPQQLQEIMRKEQFFLSRRKPFMQNSDFQSYSQVLNQFSNIVERQQYSNQSSF